MKSSLKVGLWCCFIYLVVACSAWGVTLDTSGTASGKPPIVCHPFLSTEVEFSAEYHKYVFHGSCEGDITGPYTITVIWNPETKRGSENLLLNSNLGQEYEAHFLSECTGDPWLTSATCKCVRRDGDALGLLVSHECPCTPQYLPAEVRASLIQQYQTYNSTPPETPLNLKASGKSKTEISLTWLDASNKEDGFTIERTKEGGTPSNFHVPANSTSYVDTNLSLNTLYSYRIRSDFQGLHSNYSNQASAKTNLMSTDQMGEMTRVFNAPTNLSAELNIQKEIVLHWQDNSSGESGFQIESKTPKTNYMSLATVPFNSTAHIIKDYTANTTYIYRIRAYHGNRYTPYSNEVSFNTSGLNTNSFDSSSQQVSPPPQSESMLAAQPLKPPHRLKAKSLSNSSIKLSWKEICLNVAGYVVERKKQGEFFSVIGKLGPNANIFIDQNLSASTIYYYRIKAFNSVCESEYSKEISVQTKEKGQNTKNKVSAPEE
ncbi:fibronectin type III domain-containing protein [bacterium]|nr:fibronectin type III domain-containing protein [bacterium]